ncbi:MAG: hypothetical protein ACXWQX_06430 [Bdellovibrio sp.]
MDSDELKSELAADLAPSHSLGRFSNIHRDIITNDATAHLVNAYFPEFLSESDRIQYYDRARIAVQRERKIVDGFSENEELHGMEFTARVANGFNYSVYNPHGQIMNKNQFKNLNQSLGGSGIWFIFRSYSWNHLGFQNLAGPHMSIVVGDRVYEIGRPLKKVGNLSRLSTLGPAGPIAMTVDEFLVKTSLESEALNAKPGLFFATRIAGVGEEEALSLANYYEHEASNFANGQKFKYAMDPNTDSDGNNCVTYLTEPLLNKDLVDGHDLKQALGLRRYTVSPISMMLDMGGLFLPKVSGTFLFVDGEEWLANLNSTLVSMPSRVRTSDPAFAGKNFLDPSNHPQMRGFLFGNIQFSSIPN